MNRLYTKEGRHIPETSWASYPRPQLCREDWLCLNGIWDLTVLHGKEIRREQIRVPFCAESLLAGLKTVPEIGDVLIYRRNFTVPEHWQGRRVILHFGAVSRFAVVSVNGQELRIHENSYLPFSVDITEALREDGNDLQVRVINDLTHEKPWGKQRIDRGGMWYTPCSGIWQTVWMEPVPEKHVEKLKIRCGSDWVEIRAEGVAEGTLELEGRQYGLKHGSVRIPIDSPQFWSPETPNLYEFAVTAGEDRVKSYFALRTLEIREIGGIKRLCLNGKPFFFHALLDQGYWSDGLYTPATETGFEQDILAMKELGFNTLRKHIKIEPEQFYYDCDRLGMIVFQDMVNCGEYHFLRDTILPTVGVKRIGDRKLNRNPAAREGFLDAMRRTVLQLENHPCICLWTIFNEGWGQFCADNACRELKLLDPTRFIDSTSGWFHQRESDLDSLHIYFGKLHLGKEPRAQLLSEFGGFVWKLPEHSFNTQKTYGYRIYSDRGSFVKALREIYEKEILPLAEKGLCGSVYTQVSDVEDETNGLLTFDRAVRKVHPEELDDIAAKLQSAVLKQTNDTVYFFRQLSAK